MPDTRVVCERCGVDVPKRTNDGTYARGAGALARTRAGARIITVVVALSITGISIALGVPEKVVIAGVLAIFGVVTVVAVVRMFRA